MIPATGPMKLLRAQSCRPARSAVWLTILVVNSQSSCQFWLSILSLAVNSVAHHIDVCSLHPASVASGHLSQTLLYVCHYRSVSGYLILFCLLNSFVDVSHHSIAHPTTYLPLQRHYGKPESNGFDGERAVREGATLVTNAAERNGIGAAILDCLCHLDWTLNTSRYTEQSASIR